MTAPPDPCHAPLVLQPMNRDEAERIARILKAIADPTRLQLLSLIQSSPDRQACVCDLTAPLALTQPTISHHLKILTDAGLLTRDKRGSWSWYTLTTNPLPTLHTLIT
ncbi:ArsR/SmtB family transcription factor [Spirillospora sp. CA-294931]|uniref:ArsR/SmtB family transcription factor n=1 Tax=Spirillospora sp. CA-294931 TaxID=3240042 RepID=UPI003D8DA1A7